MNKAATARGIEEEALSLNKHDLDIYRDMLAHARAADGKYDPLVAPRHSENALRHTTEDVLLSGLEKCRRDFVAQELVPQANRVENLLSKLREPQTLSDRIAYQEQFEKELCSPAPAPALAGTEKATPQAPRTWDAFICHASEDKDAFVHPLALALKQAGAKVWCDKFCLRIGDSLRRKIDEGLRECRFGIVVLSKHFFERKWPQRELDGLAQREEGTILPVWHGVTADDVRGYSPSLAGIVASQSAAGLTTVVQEILGKIRPLLAEVAATGGNQQDAAMRVPDTTPAPAQQATTAQAGIQERTRELPLGKVADAEEGPIKVVDKKTSREGPSVERLPEGFQ